MRHIHIRRKWARRSAVKNLGIDPDQQRVFTSQVREQTEASRILRLPIDFRYWAPLQDPDGNLYFMYGVHPYGTYPFGP